jgi:nitroreductase
MITKKAKTLVDVHRIIAHRWSARAFDITKPVTREQILSLCEAGRWAPSCYGDEPWRFIIWDKNHNKDDYNKAFNCLGEWNQRWVKNAPVILAAFSDDKFRKNSEPNRWAQYDTGAASENICLQAVALGLIAHQMGGFDEEKLKATFNIPSNFRAMAMIAVGYQTHEETLEEQFRTLEIAERFRRPLGSTFFDSQWEKPII